METADLALWSRWQQHGDADAFREIALRHGRMVYATCLRVLGNATEAEDITQECFEVLVRTASGPRRHLGGWLHSVAVSRCINRIRSVRQRQAREVRYVREAHTASDNAWNDIYEHVDAALLALPDRLRIPILLHYFEDQTHDAIARELGLSRSAVTRRIERGIEKLRKTLARRGAYVGTVALAAALASAARSEALSATLHAAIAKLALAGPAKTAVGTTVVAAGALLVKQISIAAGAVLLIAGAVWGVRHAMADTPARAASAKSGAPLEASASKQPVLDTPTPGTTPSPTQATTPSEGLGAVRGRVYYGDTQQPARDVAVFLVPDPPTGNPLLVKSNEAGTYRIENVAPGNYRAKLEANRLAAQDARDTPLVEVRAGQVVENVDLPILRGIVVHGTVVQEDGTPAGGMTVYGVDFRDSSYGTPVWALSRTDGSFVMCGFSRTQDFYLTAYSPDESKGREFVSDIYGPIKLGDEGLSNASVTVYRAAVLAGRVVDQNGRPVAGARATVGEEPVVIFGFRNQVCRGEPSAADGSFVLFGVPAGRYRLMASPPRLRFYLWASPPWSDFQVAKGQRIDGITLAIDTGHVIGGRVMDDAGKPLEKVCVEAQNESDQKRDYTNADGRYAFTSLKDGPYTVSVNPALPLSLASSRSAQLSSVEPKENVLPGTTDADFIVRAPAAGSVEGWVVANSTGQPVTSFSMHCDEAKKPNESPKFQAFSDPKGAFRLAGVSAGKATLTVRAEGCAETACVVPEVVPGETVRNVTIRMEAGAVVNGSVVDQAGRPIPKAAVFAGATLAEGNQQRLADATSDGRGLFRIEGLPDSVERLAVRHPDYAEAFAPLKLRAGTETPVTVVLTPGGVLKGKVFLGERPWSRCSIDATSETGRRATSTDGDGAYRIERLAAGQVTVFVSARAESNEGPQSRRQIFTRTIIDGQTTKADIHFVTGTAEVQGHVTRHGVPVNQASLSLVTRSEDRTEYRVAATASDGSFAFRDLPAGRVDLEVSIEPGNLRRTSLELQEGKVASQRIELGAGSAVEGKISGPPDFAARLLILSGEVPSVRDVWKQALDTSEAQPGRVAMIAMPGADGAYRVPGLERGHYTVAAILLDHGAPVFRDDLEQASIRAVDVTGDDTIKLDFELR